MPHAFAFFLTCSGKHLTGTTSDTALASLIRDIDLVLQSRGVRLNSGSNHDQMAGYISGRGESLFLCRLSTWTSAPVGMRRLDQPGGSMFDLQPPRHISTLRISPVAPSPHEGPLTEPTASAQPRPQERVLMPRTGPLGWVELGYVAETRLPPFRISRRVRRRQISSDADVCGVSRVRLPSRRAPRTRSPD